MAKILVVEDDPVQREILAHYLEAEGYEVVEMASGMAMDHMIEESLPDLVLTDLIMPDQEGIETIMGIRRLRPEMPIVAMSSNALYLDVARTLGANAALQKPLDLDQMIDTVSRFVQA